jgi:hypothetical protein
MAITHHPKHNTDSILIPVIIKHSILTRENYINNISLDTMPMNLFENLPSKPIVTLIEINKIGFFFFQKYFQKLYGL